MNESTTDHDYTDPPPLPGADHYTQQLAAATAGRHRATDPRPAPHTGDAAAPVPLLEGTFAIFVTPDESIVIAYRPRGADEDKRFVVPSFVVKMATSQSGQTPTQIFDALKEGM